MPISLSDNYNKHVAIITFPFGSHPLPLFHLAIKLAHASPSTTFSFFSTSKSNQTLFSKPNNLINIPHNIQPFDVSDGLPQDHVLGHHPFERLNFFLHSAHDNLQKSLDLAEKNSHKKITCILADAFVTPSLALAQSLNVPWVAIWLPLSSSLSLHFYTHLIRQRTTTSLDFLPGLSFIKVEDIPKDVLKPLDGEEESLFSKTLASMGEVLPHAKAVVMSFYEELDPPLFVSDMKSKLKSLLYVGPLSLPPSDTDHNTVKTNECMVWLDKQKARSVAYISFGSVGSLPHDEIVQVCEALEACEFPFLWSLRDNVKASLPEGFLERTSKRGKIVPWAPQMEVLGHGSVGVFVTHCGSNSVAEGIVNGVPMICRPLFGDHGMCARMVEDVWGIGVKIESGVFTKSGLIKSLNLILVEDEGNIIRNNAFMLKQTVEVAAGPQGKAAQDFNTLVELIHF